VQEVDEEIKALEQQIEVLRTRRQRLTDRHPDLE
jgi:prefoldin subunit 5